MTLVKRNGNFLNPLPMLFDDFFNRDLFNWGNSNFSDTNTTIPAVNIKETAENYEVEVAAPGMTKKDFKIELAAPGLEKKDFKIAVEDKVLTISSEKEDKKEEKKENYRRREFSYSSFSRSFQLPENVLSDKIDAKYENGVLKLSIPKKAISSANPKKEIKVS